MSGLGAYCEVDIEVRGEPDQRSGYLVSIAEIDHEVRAHVAPLLLGARPPATEALALLPRAAQLLAGALPAEVARVSLRPHPFLTMSFAPAKPDEALVTLRFDFSASHRLHVKELSDAENEHLFGKCARPSGHGHNYRLDVTIAVPSRGHGGGTQGGPAPAPTAEWDRIVHRELLDRLDHRHLNIDCPEFRELNPSVENIARVCFDSLKGPLAKAGAALRSVRLWETEKTWCSYPG